MIARITAALVGVLERGMSEVLTGAGQVVACSPSERGDAAISLHLYNVSQYHDVAQPATVPLARNIRAMPPRLLSLHYLLTAYSSAEERYRALDEQRLLTSAMQVLDGVPVLTQQILGFKAGIWTSELRLQPADIGLEQMSRIWERQQMPDRLSAAYVVSPVELGEPRVSVSTRVAESQTRVTDKEQSNA